MQLINNLLQAYITMKFLYENKLRNNKTHDYLKYRYKGNYLPEIAYNSTTEVNTDS